MLSGSARLLVAALVVWLSACLASYRAHPTLSAEQTVASASFPRLVVGIVEPSPTLPVEGVYRSLDEPLDLSVALIQALRASGYFAEVDFARQLTLPPDLLLTASEESGIENLNGNVPAFALSMGTYFVFPFVNVQTTTFAFTVKCPARDDSTLVKFRSKAVDVIGWVALILLPFPAWSFPWNEPPDADRDDIRVALLSHQVDLECASGRSSKP